MVYAEVVFRPLTPGKIELPPPALLTNMSRRPNGGHFTHKGLYSRFLSQVALEEPTDSRQLCFHRRTFSGIPPNQRHQSAFRASRWTISRPISELPPVTNATLPLNRIVKLHLDPASLQKAKIERE